MRWQVLLGIVAIGLLTTASIHAEMIDFSTDPNMATEWTSAPMFDPHGDSCAATTVAWNAVDEDLDMVSTNEEGLKTLYKNGATRSATDTVTMEISDLISSVLDQGTGGWSVCGLVISAGPSPILFDPAMAQYEFAVEVNTAKGVHCALSRGSTSAGLAVAWTPITTMPSILKLDVAYDSGSSEWVFLLNDSEIARDSTYTSEELPYYGIYWGGGAADTMSASVDNFGTVAVPEPSTLALLASVLLGMLCYTRRNRK